MTVTLVMLVLYSVLYFGLQKLTQDYIGSRLQHDAESVIAALTLQPDETWQVSQNKISSTYNRVHSGHYYQIIVNNLIIRSRSLFDIEISQPKNVIDNTTYYSMDAFSNERWLILMQKVIKKDTNITLLIAEDISPLQANLQQFMFFAVASVVVAIIILLFMQYQILQLGFSHLEQVREAIRCKHLGIDDASLKELPIEILPLVEEIDRLLSQLGLRAQRTRNALGNLAHELKRPLQRYQSQLETMIPEQRLIAESILIEITNVVERELRRAKIVGVSAPGRYTVIHDDLPHLIRVLKTIYPEKIIQSDYSEKLILPHDRDDLLELLGNLLDNACKHAKQTITLSFEILENGWNIILEDDGDGVSQSQLSRIAERGIRLDENVQGDGLGLAICKEIIDSYSGEMSFQKAAAGGLKVTVFLPAVNF